MAKYEQARIYAKQEYFDRFFIQNTFAYNFTKGVPAMTEDLPLHLYGNTNHPTGQLRKLLDQFPPLATGRNT